MAATVRSDDHGVKVIALVTKRPEISGDEFERLWTEAHVRVSTRLGMSPYRINLVRGTYDASPPAFDGTAEMYWPSESAFRAAMESVDGVLAAEDAARFAINIQLLIVDERVVPVGA